jgi:hypothetical protein
MSRDIRLRGGANVELQSPPAVNVRRPAPQVNRTYLAQVSVQCYQDRSAFVFSLRPQNRTDWRERFHLFQVNGHDFARLVSQTRTGNE